MRYARLFQTAGLIGVGLIVILSLAPGIYRPHTGAGAGVEHFMAYALTSFTLGWRWSSSRQRIAIIVGLFALAGSLEVLQFLVPGRHSEAAAAVISGLGGVSGVSLSAMLSRRSTSS